MTLPPETDAVLPGVFALRCPECGAGQLQDPDRRCAACGFEITTEGRVAVLAHAPNPDDYPAHGAHAQWDVRDRHFWFTSRTRFIGQLIGPPEPGADRMVEFGCSNGMVSAALEQLGWRSLGCDMHLTGLRQAQHIISGPLVCAPAGQLALVQPADLVGFFDVVEHVDDDVGVLRSALRNLRSGGRVAITVPAFQHLWSAFDDDLGHKRRYTRAEAAQLCEAAGLTVERIRYAFVFTYPLVWVQRRLLPTPAQGAFVKPPPAILNAALSWLCRLEEWLVGLGVRPPFGTSVMVVARKGAPAS